MFSQTYKYKSTTVAKYLLSRAIEEGIIMNMTKLQKLLYIAYGTYLAIKEDRLTDESPKAWPYGPVFPTTRKKLLTIDFNDYSINGDTEFDPISKDKEINDLVNLVLRLFGSWSSGQLVEWTHAIGSPWDKTRYFPNFQWNQTIPDDYIKDYFSDVIEFDDEK